MATLVTLSCGPALSTLGPHGPPGWGLLERPEPWPASSRAPGQGGPLFCSPQWEKADGQGWVETREGGLGRLS